MGFERWFGMEAAHGPGKRRSKISKTPSFAGKVFTYLCTDQDIHAWIGRPAKQAKYTVNFVLTSASELKILGIPARHFERGDLRSRRSRSPKPRNLLVEGAFFWETPRLRPFWIQKIQNGLRSE